MVSTLHKKRFDEIKKSLTVIGSRESNFLKVELLFFEALNISRDYGNDPSQNSLLAYLKRVQDDQYEKTKQHTKKSSQREYFIRRFITEFKKAISKD